MFPLVFQALFNRQFYSFCHILVITFFVSLALHVPSSIASGSLRLKMCLCATQHTQLWQKTWWDRKIEEHARQTLGYKRRQCHYEVFGILPEHEPLTINSLVIDRIIRSCYRCVQLGSTKCRLQTLVVSGRLR